MHERRRCVAAVHLGDDVLGDVLGARGFALVMVRAIAEAGGVHGGDHGLRAVRSLGLALRQMVQVRQLGRDVQHGRAVGARGNAGAATDAGRGIHRAIRFFLRYGYRVGVRRRPDVGGNETAGRLDAIKGAAINRQVLDHRERRCAPRLDEDLVAVLELAHVQLARRRRLLTTVGTAVDHHRTRAADAFATIVVERDRLFALFGELFVQHVEHLEERGVFANAGDFVRHHLAGAGGVFLAPDVDGEVHGIGGHRGVSPRKRIKKTRATCTNAWPA